MSKKKDYIDTVTIGGRKEDESVDFAELLSIMWRNRFWFTLSVIAAIIVAIFYLCSTPHTYLRTATIQIKEEKGGGLNFQDMFLTGSNSVNNEIGILRSRRLMTQVVEQLKLEVDYQLEKGFKRIELYTASPITLELLDKMAKNSSFELAITLLDPLHATINYEIRTETGEKLKREKRITLSEKFTTEYGTLRVSPTLFLDETFLNKPLFIVKSLANKKAKEYGTKLSVMSVDKQSSLASLSIVDQNPKRAEDILNKLISTYETSTIADKNTVLTYTINFISDKILAVEEDLKRIDSNIENYKKKNKLTDIPSVSSMYLQNYSKLDTEVLQLENQLNIARFMKEYLQSRAAQNQLIPANIGINNTGIQSQINKYNETMALHNRYIANSSAENPIVKDMQETLASTRISIVNAIDNLVESLKIQLEKYNQEERKSSSRIADVSSQQKYISNIERQLKIKEDLYLYLLKKLEESEIKVTITESNCTVIDYADGSPFPVAPRKVLVLLIAFVGGLALPALWLYIRSLLDTRVHTKKEIKDVVDIPIMAELPFYKSDNKGLVIEEGSRDVINEAFRLLRDNIEMMDPTDDLSRGKTVLVTSLNPASGKTFITSNLALTMSLSNAKIIVIDIDLRKATLTRLMGYSKKQAGLSTYLSGKVGSIDEIVYKYNGTNLEIIPSGALPPNPAELLKNKRFDNLMEELRKRYNYIIFDTAPYGLITDCSLCSKYADITAMVVRSGLFEKRQLPVIAEIHETKKLPCMSVIINAISIKKLGNAYAYAYGNEPKKDWRDYVKLIFGI